MGGQSVTKGQVVKYAWYVVSAAYAAFRILLAEKYVKRYGLSVPWFAVIEIASTIPYAIGVAKLVESFVHKHLDAAFRWGFVAFLGWIAPDAFVLATTHHRPRRLIVIILVWLGISGILALQGLRSRVVSRRRAHRKAL